ncbi:MAG: serine protease [Desulfobacterales bacterium GWB2_56_26]|nr:MAG: serine protease [Desulfobacterales bacterium GWB2_56_26]
MKFLIACIGLLACFCTPLISQAASPQEDLGEQVLEEINLARAEPLQYADYIREWRKRFKGKYYQLPGTSFLRQTREGIAAMNEAIEFLNQQKPLPPLNWSPGLAAAAAELIREQGKTGATGHEDRKGGGTTERIKRHGTWEGKVGENIAYVPNESRLLVMQLIVDDGVPDRGHRKNLFNSHFKEAGVACGPHTRFGTMCVADFSARFKDK